MIVAMPVVGMVQMAVHQVVHVVTMRCRLVPATRTVPVLLRVPAASVRRGTRGRIARIYRDHVFVEMVSVRLVQVPVVEIVHVPVVLDGYVPAAFSVHVGVPLMNVMLCCHEVSLPSSLPCQARPPSHAPAH